jgi:dihydrofolate reductase
VPVVLGTGKQLFGRKLRRQRMKLRESRALVSGSVLLRYEPYTG